MAILDAAILLKSSKDAHYKDVAFRVAKQLLLHIMVLTDPIYSLNARILSGHKPEMPFFQYTDTVVLSPDFKGKLDMYRTSAYDVHYTLGFQALGNSFRGKYNSLNILQEMLGQNFRVSKRPVSKCAESEYYQVWNYELVLEFHHTLRLPNLLLRTIWPCLENYQELSYVDSAAHIITSNYTKPYRD